MSKNSICAALLCISVLLFGASGIAGEAQVLGSIPGNAYLAIEAAAPEIRSREVDIANYEIGVAEDGEIYKVVVADSDLSVNGFGVPEGKLKLTVEVNKSDRSVIRSYFAR